MKLPYLASTSKKEKLLRRVFVWGVWLKAFDGVVEVVGGMTLLFSGTPKALVEAFLRNGFMMDSNNFIAVHLRQALPAFLADSGRFAAAYLLSHGVIKVVLAAGLLRNKLWTYPSAMAVFTAFIAYQLYRYAFTRSIFLLVLTVLDLIILWLTWHEYRFFRKYHAFAE